MKTHRKNQSRAGFTLMELMVAMAITTIIVTVLVSITSIATDTWNRSRAELRAMRQGKAMVESMARDFEALVVRKGNEFEWLSAETPQSMPGGSGGNLESSNACDLIFFTAATDRYEGKIGTSTDKGGDVSCVAYKLEYRDPIDAGGSSGSDFDTFVLNRLLVDPDKTFEDLLGQTDLKNAFNSYDSEIEEPENFVCENVYQFSVVFHIEVTENSGNGATVKNVPIVIGESGGSQVSKSLRILGNGIESDASGSVTDEELAGGRLVAVEISLTVVSDFGIDQIRRRKFSGTQQSEFLAQNSYQYTKLIQVPGL
ncbi:MAG: prepilin-type N-terminal cleavage/methylation domain-containing protein [Akkermansiaceae bacterium]|nr:prepilin-type N-terminal cleavage/methylation domain-containing protein [Akkermansiaceae bacterium]